MIHNTFIAVDTIISKATSNKYNLMYGSFLVILTLELTSLIN